MNLLAWLAPLALLTLGAVPHARIAAVATEDAPPIFAALSFEDAVAKTKNSELVLVVKATASWCPPCKKMDQTTWRDAGVTTWFEKNGLAIQFDVDRQRELAASLRIQAMPTMIAYVKGAEFDRVVGYQGPAEMLAWVEGVKAGKRSIEAVRSRASQAPAGSEEEVDTRYDLARDLARSGKLDEATEEFAWLWVNSKNARGYGGVRGSFMASEMERLASRHPPAKERFTRFRDELGPRLESEKVDPDDVNDWIVLNGVVGESSKTLAWFDRVRDDARWAPLVDRVSFRLERLLQDAGRWSDAARFVGDPLARVRKAHASLQRDDEAPDPGSPSDAQDKMMRESQERYFRESVGKIYAAVLAAGREDEAASAAALAVELDDTANMRTALVYWALEAKQPRAAHGPLLDEAEKAGGEAAVKSLRKKLAKATAPAGAR